MSQWLISSWHKVLVSVSCCANWWSRLELHLPHLTGSMPGYRLLNCQLFLFVVNVGPESWKGQIKQQAGKAGSKQELLKHCRTAEKNYTLTHVVRAGQHLGIYLTSHCVRISHTAVFMVGAQIKTSEWLV